MRFRRFPPLGSAALALALITGLLAACTADLPTDVPAGDLATVITQQARVDVCHVNGTGAYSRITIAEAAYESHVAHGDVNPGQPVPGMGGYIFDGDCQPVADPIPGTYENHLYDDTLSKNCWHYVTITREDATTLRWTNSCGVTWTYVATADPTKFTPVGAPAQASYQVDMHVEFDTNGNVLWVTGPAHERYDREG